MEVARKKELDFFRGKQSYGDLRNVGMGFLSSKLSNHLIGAIRKQLPVIQHNISEGIVALEKELEGLGGPQSGSRGGMLHLVLQLCRTFEEAFGKANPNPFISSSTLKLFSALSMPWRNAKCAL